MERENKQMIFIYTLVFIIIILLVMLTKIIIESRPKEQQVVRPTQQIDVNPYPNVNAECTFNIKYTEYNSLTSANCQGGYTRYDINDIILEATKLNVSIIYSDKNQPKTGIFINDKQVTSNIDDISKIKFGIFENKLFILDNTNKKSNVLSYNKAGIELYNLSRILRNEKIKDLSTGDTVISSTTIDPNSFVFAEGYIEFNSLSNNCQNGEKSKGSHYKITYKDTKFELPEFMNLINCN